MPRKEDKSEPITRPVAKLRPLVPNVVLLAAVAVLLTVLAPEAWLVLFTDGWLTAALLAAAFGWGAWPAAWLGLGRRPAGQAICVAAALGLGTMGLITLGLGVTGLLTRIVAWALLALGWALGLARAYRVQSSALGGTAESEPGVQGAAIRVQTRPQRAADTATPDGRTLQAGAWGSVWVPAVAQSGMLLTLAIPVAVALFGACVPPGLLWNGEARSYDALEYHLQAPREYYDAGRIIFLPHNVYASFPQQVEMLYLLLMHLAGGSLAAAIPAQLLHVACGALTVMALVAWTPRGWPRCIVAVTAGSVPWLAYVGCLAYVELGMLSFAAVAAGLVLDHFHADAAAGRTTSRAGAAGAGSDWRLTLAAGLCAGFAGGCKYVALAFVGAALAVAWLCTMQASPAVRIKRVVVFAAGGLAAFSPWLIRNVAFTGNPVYPFAYGWFDGAAWSAEQAEQWARGHALPPEKGSAGTRIRIIADELLGSRMFGLALFVLAAAGVVLGRSRVALFLTIWFALIVAGWALFTHMPGRFVLPVIVPLGMLGVCGLVGTRVACAPGPDLPQSRVRWARITGGILACVAVSGAVANDVTLAWLLRQHDQWCEQRGAPLHALIGTTEGFAQLQPLSPAIPPAGKTWLVGEARVFYLPSNVHYTVVFSRDPWLEYARHAAPAECVAWLAAQNVARVVFSWDEIERLQGSYGFPTLVTPQWVQSLIAAGLRRVEPPPETDPGNTEVYEVPPK